MKTYNHNILFLLVPLSHSFDVSGIVGSSIVVTTSTNGTAAIAPSIILVPYITAPIKSPPALPPEQNK